MTVRHPSYAGDSHKKRIQTCHSLIELTAHYPEENPEGAEEAVTKTLAYLGVFEGIHRDDASNSTI